MQALNDIRFTSQMDRVKCRPWGLFGGLSGAGNSVAVHRFGADRETHFPNGKAFNQVLKPGDAYILRSGGGGGYGSPLERDLATLERDVRCGYVSRDEAEKSYGAVFADDGAIDAEATTRRRDEMRRKGLPVDEPVSPTPIFPDSLEPQKMPVPEQLTEEEKVVFAMNCRCCT